MYFDKLRKIMESCHLNFLIGSGASCPFLGTLSNIETLLTDLSVIDNFDERTILEVSIKKLYFDIAIKGNLLISGNDSEELSETKLSYKEFVQSINTILNKRKSNLVSKQANVFTTNMDLFLEYTLEDSKIAYNDGFFGRLNPIYGTDNFHNIIKKTSTYYEYTSEIPLFNVFKLHGSVNWKLKSNIIHLDHSLDILKKIDEIVFGENDFVEIRKEETIEDLRKKITLKKVLEIHSEFLEAYNELVMINPTKQKFETTTRDLTFYELLRMYSNHLERENSVLFVFGFSFADEHIREITKRVVISNPTLLVIIFAHSRKSKEAIEKEIPQRGNVEIIYDNEDKKKYTLDTINKDFFKNIADKL